MIRLSMRGARSYCSKHLLTITTVSAGLLLGVVMVRQMIIKEATHSVSKNQVENKDERRVLHLPQASIHDRRREILVPNYPQLTEEKLLRDVQNLSRKIEKCFEATNLRLFDGLSTLDASKSAARYVKEFRKVIPMSYDSPNSHCWKMNYEVRTKGQHVWGHIGNVTFNQVIPDDYRSSLLRDVQNNFNNHFTSKTICLPSLFLLGFPKCGSTFLWCLIERVINTTIKVKPASFKEPGWWYERHDTVKTLDASELGRYIANFATPIRAVDTSRQTNVVFAEGTPGMAYAAPRFDQKDHLQLNYCLLPTVVPHLLPLSKFIMIMRNPVDALYSLFWWACKGRLTNRTQKAVPNAFHKGVMLKMGTFNKCMRDEETEEISHACSLSAADYSLCISHPKRLALLDKCVSKISPGEFVTKKSGLPGCAKIGFNMYMYYVHVRRWLSVTPRDNFYFLTLNDTSDPVGVAKRVFQMMDIPLPTSDFDQVAMKAYTECQQRKNKQKISYGDSSVLQMRTDTRRNLEKFFAPFNKMLSDLLGDSKFLFT